MIELYRRLHSVSKCYEVRENHRNCWLAIATKNLWYKILRICNIGEKNYEATLILIFIMCTLQLSLVRTRCQFPLEPLFLDQQSAAFVCVFFSCLCCVFDFQWWIEYSGDFNCQAFSWIGSPWKKHQQTHVYITVSQQIQSNSWTKLWVFFTFSFFLHSSINFIITPLHCAIEWMRMKARFILVVWKNENESREIEFQNWNREN